LPPPAADAAATAPARPLPRAFYGRDPRHAAPELLNKVLAVGGVAGRIVEVEAYAGADDPASHAHRGPTARNATMFGPPGHLYVYRSYGLHWCANAVFGPAGTGLAVLVRALAPLAGLATMAERRRAARQPRDLCRGPGRLAQALGLTGDHDGADLVTGVGGVVVLDDGVAPPPSPGVSARIGVTRAADRPWRWYVPGERCVSAVRSSIGPVPCR